MNNINPQPLLAADGMNVAACEPINEAKNPDYDLVLNTPHSKLWKLQRCNEKGAPPCFFAVVNDREADRFVIWFLPNDYESDVEIKLNACFYNYLLLDSYMLKQITILSNQARLKFDAWIETKAGQRYSNEDFH